MSPNASQPARQAAARPPAEPFGEPHHETGAGPDPIERAERQRALILRVVRVAFVILVVTVTLLAIIDVDANAAETGRDVLVFGWPITVTIALVLAAGVLAADVLSPAKKISTLVSIGVGLLAAMLATVAFGFVLDLLASSYGIENAALLNLTKLLAGVCLAYLGISIVLQTEDDFRLVIPYVEFAKQLRGAQPLILDSSALVDARIADVARTGFVQSPIVVPAFVMAELQLLADSGDRLQRSKGRRGLELITKLQRDPNVDVSIDETPIPGKAVDQMLVELARKLPGVIVTTDSALAQIATIRSVPVLNMHELAQAMRSPVTPGETIELAIDKPGEHEGQGVGYLPDGTMVVVENGAPAIGQTTPVTVASSLQTAAGRMIFARVDTPEEPPPPIDTTADEADSMVDASQPNEAPAPPRRVQRPKQPREPRSPFPPKPPAGESRRNPRR